jgi:hypothetical protein
MIEVARAPNLLVVLDGPSAFYRFATALWALLVLLSFFGAGDVHSLDAPLVTALIAVGLLGMPA